MPWCDTCARFWSPNSLPATGECPTCGHRFHAPSQVADDQVADEYKAPWHFKLMVIMAVVYVTWRIIQLITWAI